MSFNPSNVKILENGEHFVGVYHRDQAHIEVKLNFREQGRVRLLVSVNGKVLEDIELRLPTTNSLSAKMHATALIMSAVERNS